MGTRMEVRMGTETKSEVKYRVVKEEPLDGVYVASRVWEEGKWQAAFASETQDVGKTVRVDLDSLEEQEMLSGPGGCMGVIPVPGKEGEFLTIEKFFPVFQSENAQIVWNTRKGTDYEKKVICILPFAHRIDIVRAFGNYYLAACSLCRKKDFTEDWSTPGSVYVGRLDLEKKYVIDFRPILDGIFQNHGFTKVPGDEAERMLIAGRSGIVEIRPAEEGGETAWKMTTLLEEPCSDVVVTDIDGDGELEYGILSPFHGERFRVCKRRQDRLESIYELPGEHAFGHAIYGGQANGKNLILVGFRGAGKELYAVYMGGDGALRADLVDEGKGPANVTVVSGRTQDYICAANRQSDVYTIYGRDGA